MDNKLENLYCRRYSAYFFWSLLKFFIGYPNNKATESYGTFIYICKFNLFTWFRNS